MLGETPGGLVDESCIYLIHTVDDIIPRQHTSSSPPCCICRDQNVNTKTKVCVIVSGREPAQSRCLLLMVQRCRLGLKQTVIPAV